MVTAHPGLDLARQVKGSQFQTGEFKTYGPSRHCSVRCSHHGLSQSSQRGTAGGDTPKTPKAVTSTSVGLQTLALFSRRAAPDPLDTPAELRLPSDSATTGRTAPVAAVGRCQDRIPGASPPCSTHTRKLRVGWVALVPGEFQVIRLPQSNLFRKTKSGKGK